MESNAAPEIIPEDRKELERLAYEQIYSADRDISDRSVREELIHESEDYFVERLKSLAQKGISALEIGCGVGDHALLAARCGAKVHGIDIAEAGIAACRARAAEAGLSSQAEFSVGDVERLGFPDASFDLIIDHEVFSSLDLDRALPELLRVLKPGGAILGVECLGHNPIFNLNRRLNVARGRRTKWAADHILRVERLRTISEHFSASKVSCFHLLAVLLSPLRKLPAPLGAASVRALQAADRVLVGSVSPLSRFAFKTVFELTGKRR